MEALRSSRGRGGAAHQSGAGDPFLDLTRGEIADAAPPRVVHDNIGTAYAFRRVNMGRAGRKRQQSRGKACRETVRSENASLLMIERWSSFQGFKDNAMAERKSALRRAPPRPELMQILERAKSVVISEEQLQEQRASFAYGNAPKDSRITKASAISAAKRIRLFD